MLFYSKSSRNIHRCIGWLETKLCPKISSSSVVLPLGAIRKSDADPQKSSLILSLLFTMTNGSK
jgi:hypothetical protein